MLWKNLFLLLICFLAMLIVFPTFFPEKDWLFHKKLKLGLDLQGGSSIVLEVDFEEFMQNELANWRNELQKSLNDKNANNIISIINDNALRITNIDRATFKSFKIPKISENFDILEEKENILLQLKIGRVRIMKRQLLQECVNNIRNRIDGMGINETNIRQYADNKLIVQMPNVADPNEVKKMIGKTAKLTFHVVDEIYDVSNLLNSEVSHRFDQLKAYDTTKKALFLVKKRVEMDGSFLKNAKAGYSQDKKPGVFFEFDRSGSIQFTNVTKLNVGKALAILIDGEVVTAPVIKEPITNGRGMISGNFSMKEASNLAIMLRSGALPAKMQVIEEKIIGPTIGAKYIKQGIQATIIAFIVVVLIMLIFYQLLGFFAALALFMNIVIVLMIMVVLGVTLTLPGIAGIVLTIGMAVDSNILIFERMIEERKKLESKLNKVVVQESFKHALTTIMDSNITTLICALVLFVCGVGMLKSFAIALMIGILTSLFTAVFITRAMIDCLLRLRT